MKSQLFITQSFGWQIKRRNMVSKILWVAYVVYNVRNIIISEKFTFSEKMFLCVKQSVDSSGKSIDGIRLLLLLLDLTLLNIEASGMCLVNKMTWYLSTIVTLANKDFNLALTQAAGEVTQKVKKGNKFTDGLDLSMTTDWSSKLRPSSKIYICPEQYAEVCANSW